MTKTTASLALVLSLAPLQAGAAPLVPQVPRGRVAEYEAAARVFGRAGILEPLADMHERWEFEGLRPYRALTLGTYARVHRNLKLGLFYRVQKGARHDDDWVTNNPGEWSWRDTQNRPENLLVLDATPRVKLGASITAAFKVRYEHNFFNNHSAIKLEPELAWFCLDGLRPRATVFVRYGDYRPLNFGSGSYYERWWYLAGLWHLDETMSFGPSVAFRDVQWSTSSDFRTASGGDAYRVVRRSVVWGLTLVVRAH